MPIYYYILIGIFLALAIYSLVKNKLNKKGLLSFGLWILIGLFTCLVIESIMKPIRFESVRDDRYAKVIKKLEVIGDMEKLYRSSKGEFAKTFDELFSFMDTAKIYLTQTRVEKVKEYDKVYRIDIEKDIKIIDTVAVLPAIEHIRNISERFKNYEQAHKGDYKTVKNIPLFNDDMEPQVFILDAGDVIRGKNKVPVFEAKVSKKVILFDQDSDLLNKEAAALVGVKGEFIKIGDMLIPTTEGNWGKVE